MDVVQTIPGKRLALLSVSLVLSACGGGGGGGTVSTPTPIKTFTTWRSTDLAGSEVQLNGQGKQAAYVYAGAATDIYNLQNASANALFSFDASGGLSGLVLASTTPTSSTTAAFTGSEISVLAWDTDFVKANSASRNAVISNPKSLAWDYQSFGVWETGTDTNSRDYGVISLGAPTAASAIPGSGTADFTGKVVGSYVNTAGVGHTALADLNVGVDWVNRSLSFTTTGTETSPNLNTTAFTANTDLNLTGNLSYVAGTNSFSGTLTTTSGLTGNSTGQFYGPAAQEMGGVFFLQGTDAIPETYAGAYGAKR